MNKKLLIVAIVLAVIAAGAAGFYFYSNKNNDNSPQGQDKPFAVDKKDVDENQLPKGFPKNLPAEVGSAVVQNHELTATTGQLQSTRVVTTAKPLDQAVKMYSDFFAGLGWLEISTTKPDANTINTMMRNKDDVLTIVARMDATTKEKTVEITLNQANNAN